MRGLHAVGARVTAGTGRLMHANVRIDWEREIRSVRRMFRAVVYEFLLGRVGEIGQVRVPGGRAAIKSSGSYLRR